MKTSNNHKTSHHRNDHFLESLQRVKFVSPLGVGITGPKKKL